MQLKFFGSSGPTAIFKRDLELLLSLDSVELSMLVDWFAKLPDFMDVQPAEVSGIATEIRLNPEEIGRTVALIRYVLANRRALSLTSDDLAADFKALGYSADQQQKLSFIFGSLNAVQERVHMSMMQRSYETVGIATVDDVNLIWDVRPVFEEFAYPTERVQADCTRLLTHSNMLIVEFVISRADGKNETTSFQVNEREFSKVWEAFERAKKQLEILKLRYRAEV